MKSKNTFYTDNFVYGRMDKDLLDSVNPGVYALFGCLMYYEEELQKGIERGEKWIYSNSDKFCPQKTSFDEMVERGPQGTNCAMPAGWAFIDLGINPYPRRFWGAGDCSMAHREELAPYMLKCCDIDNFADGPLFSELYEKGEIKPGDILLAKGHTFIYIGKDQFFAAGHDGQWHKDETAVTDDPRKAVFDSWICDMKTNFDYGCHVYWRIRLHDDYIPALYRNRAGKMVKNPEAE